jgi:hypothetical protein
VGVDDGKRGANEGFEVVGVEVVGNKDGLEEVGFAEGFEVVGAEVVGEQDGLKEGETVGSE